MESKVYSSNTRDADRQQYELTTRMKLQAENIKRISGHDDFVDLAGELADTVLEFLKVSGWTRS